MRCNSGPVPQARVLWPLNDMNPSLSLTVSLSVRTLSPSNVDAVKGNDSNQGTLARPVKTVLQAVKLSRLQREAGQQGLVYLRAGTYYLSETVSLGTEDSDLVISGYPNEKATVSGGKEYKFDWVKVVDKMGPIMPGVNAIKGTVSVGGESNGLVWFYGKVDSPIDSLHQELYLLCIHLA